jgi:hypothetical protein
VRSAAVHGDRGERPRSRAVGDSATDDRRGRDSPCYRVAMRPASARGGFENREVTRKKLMATPLVAVEWQFGSGSWQ